MVNTHECVMPVESVPYVFLGYFTDMTTHFNRLIKSINI